MITEWKAYLENAGAVFENDTVAHFGKLLQEIEIATRKVVISDLSYLGMILVEGNDAQSFLQGQLTNDVAEVSTQQSQLSGYCSPKGRLLAILRLIFSNDKFYLQLPAELLEPTIKRLSMYVLRSKVTLVDASDTMVHIGLSGSTSDTLLKSAIGEPPQNVDQVIAVNNIIIIRIAGIQPRFELYGPVNEIKQLWEQLAVHATPVASAAWKRLDILAGIPVIYTRTMDSFVPQMVNLGILEGISFKKGCYTGQEVVARLHYRGTLKRHMYLAHVNSDIAPLPGDTLYSPNASDAEGVGIIVDAQASPDGGYDVLAVIRIPYADSSQVRLYNSEGAVLRFLDLPYQHKLTVNNS